MPESISWVKNVILGKYPEIEKKGGVDFSGDGKIEGSEQLKEGFVVFLEKNYWQIRKDIEFVNSQGDLSPRNLIHQVIFVESKMFKPQEVREAYRTLNAVLKEVKNKLKKSMLPAEKLKTVFKVLEEMGFKLRPQEKDHLLVSNLKHKELDCDTSSFIVLAVAHEMGWPVKIAVIPEHVFVRWDDGVNRFNIDYGEIRSDKYYIKLRKAKPQILGEREIIGLIYHNRALARESQKDYEGAFDDFSYALTFNPRDVEAYHNLGVLKARFGDHDGAIKDYDKAISLNSHYALTYLNRGEMKMEKKDYASAAKDFARAFYLNSLELEYFARRGTERLKKKEFKNAVEDFTIAIKLNQRGVEICQKSRAANLKLKQARKVKQNEREIKQLDKQRAQLLAFRAVAQLWAEKIE